MASKRTDTWYYPMPDIALEFLKYAPAYAQEEARQAIWMIHELQSQGLIRTGLYYVVLTDLVGSTSFAARHGNDAMTKRIESFITESFRALNTLRLSNVGVFVKEIGDAVLYIFQHFPDVLRWIDAFREGLSHLNEWIQSEEPYLIRTCVHIGEVYLQGANPLSLAVSQTFKMEKSVRAGDVVLTHPAYMVAWPTIARAYHGFEDYGEVVLEGYPANVTLHRLSLHDEEDLKRITEESMGHDL